MTSRISLIAAVLAAGSLASCSDSMSAVSSDETETGESLTAPADMGSQGDSHLSSMETSQQPAAPSASPVPDTGGMTRNVVDGICEGTTCMGNDPSPSELAGSSGVDDFVSATNDQ